MTINKKDIKDIMKNYYDAYVERADESYCELFLAFITLRNAGLIKSEDIKWIIGFDDFLFNGYGNWN